MLYIGIDISKISTAICVENNNKTQLFSYSTKIENNKWVLKLQDQINFRFINYNYSDKKNYSDVELSKLEEFENITNIIIKDILDNIKNNDEIKIGIEGYSYNSKGPIFDLIEFSTLLKHKIFKNLGFNNVEILSPLSLKVESCKMVYEPRIELIGKKEIKEKIHIENKNGKKAINFNKWDMLYCFIESNINLEMKDWCIENKFELIKNKEVPKPIDDIIDAIFIKEYLKNKR